MQTTQETTSAALAEGLSDLHSPLSVKRLAGPVQLTLLPMGARFNLRIARESMAAASVAFGVQLPDTIGESGNEAGRRALCLGPDEWVLYAGTSEINAVSQAFEDIYATAPHSLVDISEREVAVSISGEQSMTLLSVGLPIDLKQIAIGEGRRTVFDGASVVLHRHGESDWRMEVWRSFLPHVWALLNTANREIGTGL